MRKKYVVEISCEHQEDVCAVTVEDTNEGRAIAKANEVFWKDFCKACGNPEYMWEDAMGAEVTSSRIVYISCGG